jgi:hypothetical protein
VRIVNEARETRDGLRAIRRELVGQLGNPRESSWSFPGAGKDLLPTWYSNNLLGGPIAIAVGDDGYWENRTPILIARAEFRDSMTPTAEINIPLVDGRVNRSVAGCLCLGADGRFLLAHRGKRFTTTPSIIPKETIHQYFSKWLQVVNDDDKETPVILVGYVGRGLVGQMAAFADQVAALKKRWGSAEGKHADLSKAQGWRDELRFPDTIERAIAPGKTAFEYRHGPIQARLQESLETLLFPSYRAVLNKHIDLALLKNDNVAAIFEVKTDLGPQLFSGIGQLYWYRQQFGSAATPLFLVVPNDVRRKGELVTVGRQLTALGIDLVLAGDDAFRSWNDHPLPNLLREKGIRLRVRA